MALARTVDADALRQVGEWVRPVAGAAEQLLPVLAPLEPLFPEGGLRRGSTVMVQGAPGATSLALALGAAASAAGSWGAAVNLPSLGLLAAAELGVVLERVVVVPDPPSGAWATVVAALLDAVDLVWVGLPRRVALGEARRLVARARERGSVLVPVAPHALGAGAAVPAGRGWPQAADIRLRTASSAWIGPLGGPGHLEARQVEVVAEGRGASARERRIPLWLPGSDGRLAPGADVPAPQSVLCRLSSAQDGSSDKERGQVG
ncbi:MAG: hypothetical protein ACR2G7_09835 [Acidimicrobiales bacterium]